MRRFAENSEFGIRKTDCGILRRPISDFRSPTSGFTLLEVLLALGLTVVTIGLVTMSVNSTLKLVDAGRSKTERDQLARAILTKIANDVRGTFRYQPFDSTGMMSVNVKSSSSKGGQSGGGGNGATKGTGATTGASGGSSGNSSNSTSSPDQSSSSSTGGTTTSSSSYPGLYGDQYGLQIDVARLPRYDEYAFTDSSSTSGSPTDTSTTPPISDVKTVAYYLSGPQAQVSAVVSTASGQTSQDSGLVRAETDRTALQYAATQSGTTATDAGQIVAPEVVALEFYYFDGTNWQTSWDTTQGNGLPQLIKISIALSSPSRPQDQPPASTSIADLLNQDPDSVYSIVVRMSAADPIPASVSSSSPSSSTGSGGSSNSGGNTTTGGGS